ncbi:spore coat protein Z [Gracilibacillus halotolerans]|uniref:Spore coat protein Z n=1 Tax=Gracilibacillus halotolerans TaxID=74386 RepID=A0A841RPJ6_9BACI|nr:CotY/CotZ family spore coat protein [Gracilibacillus halotolerans]MBB6512578.1 spore coat protein Z [Gracilibacillus halotolerans]
MGNCHKESGSNCVADVLRLIADRQDDVEDQNCSVSCMRSINELVSPAITSNVNTVPFILYGKDNTPFTGYGANVVSNGSPTFDCVSTFIFRVSEVSEDDSCAVLELLEIGTPVANTDNPCDQIGGEEVEDLSRTGICITVDLDCFCGVSCLPPVALPPAP